MRARIDGEIEEGRDPLPLEEYVYVVAQLGVVKAHEAFVRSLHFGNLMLDDVSELDRFLRRGDATDQGGDDENCMGRIRELNGSRIIDPKR